MPKNRDDEVCQCGHARAAHGHYRSGTDCSLCGRRACQRFTAQARWRRALGRLTFR